jgi:Protein of unknown function (DUF3606)
MGMDESPPLILPIKVAGTSIESRRDRELRAWAQAMGTTVELLQKAIDAVGISPRKVRSYLREQAGRG